jgi:hypothetical protein
MKKSKVKLVSNNPYNFRHGKEDPIVVGLKYITPEGLHRRLCVQIVYGSDMKVDYIPFDSVFGSGDWILEPYTKEDAEKNLASH